MDTMKVWIVGFLTVLMLSSCSKVQEEPPLVITTDTWIGAAPLYYAHAMGWLRGANIEMLQSDSINENLQRYSSGAADIVTGTVHEYHRLKQKHTDLIPIIIYDRSYGGDVILSNKTVLEIGESNHKVDLYLESDTVNEEMFNYFLADYNFSREKFTLHNRTQSEIGKLIASKSGKPMIAITYSPNDTLLKKQGFFEIASSKSDDYLVVDAFYLSRKTGVAHAAQTKALREALTRSVAVYHRDPKGFYEKVKPYLGGVSYEEFTTMIRSIQWTDNHQLSSKMLQQLQKNHFPTQELLP